MSFSCLINGDLDIFGQKNCMVCITVLLNNLGVSWAIWPWYMESLKPLIAYIVHGDYVLLGRRERGNFFVSLGHCVITILRDLVRHKNYNPISRKGMI